MRIVEPSVEVLTPIDGKEILKFLERIGRTCYKSEDRITEGSAEKFIKMIMGHNPPHEAIIEHVSISVKFVCDRGVSHEIVRHRLSSFAQESTRYVNYTKSNREITLIRPSWFETEVETLQKYTNKADLDDVLSKDEDDWLQSMFEIEEHYKELIEQGWKPQEARCVLPHSLKTELVMTTNLRGWRNFLKLRTSKEAHPQIRQVAIRLLHIFKESLPIIFDDINP